MTARSFGLIGGIIVFCLMRWLPAPAGMTDPAWSIAAMTILMAIWWMTEALPLTVTALLPFLLVPMFGVMPAGAIAKEYYSPILFLLLGGAFLALAIERVGLHKRLALSLLSRAGNDAWALVAAVMAATVIVSLFVSNTSTALIMMPIALAILEAAKTPEGETQGMAGALPIGIAFAATVGGFGLLTSSPTNAISVGLIERALGVDVTFLTWAKFGIPLVIVTTPIAIIAVIAAMRLPRHGFDVAGTRAVIGQPGPWSVAEKRMVPLFALVFAGWVLQPWIEPFFPDDALTDGTIAILGAMLLFVVPDGSGRPLLVWKEADKAPWGVIMMFGGGLALAAAITASGLADWLGIVLAPLKTVHPLIVITILTGLVIVITEFASNVATASGVMPVVAALIAATGADPLLLAMPAAFAASWGFMLPSGTGPNALAWSTGHVSLPSMLKSGLWLDLAGVPLMVGVVWAVGAIF